MILAERLFCPDNIESIMWDMDGVLIDSLGLDMDVCNRLLREHFGPDVQVTREFIASIFAYSPEDFWKLILEHIQTEFQVRHAESHFSEMLEVYEKARRTVAFELNPGIVEILDDARERGLKLAVVSNNPTEDVKASLANAGIFDKFHQVVGNDIKRLEKKPAPDTYLLASELLGVRPEKSTVVEDSLLGAKAGFNAGCFVVGVATGGDSFSALGNSGYAHQVYRKFKIPQVELHFGNVRDKKIDTPNDFVSHAIEHIYWRLGVGGSVSWFSNNWRALGEMLGEKINCFPLRSTEAVALGMIDDGSAEIHIRKSDQGSLVFQATEKIDLDWFLSVRCEQTRSGRELVELLEGLADGLQAEILARVCSFVDPHHTWEGVFRGVGIALNKMFAPDFAPVEEAGQETVSNRNPVGDIEVLDAGNESAAVRRTTAESDLMVRVDFGRKTESGFAFDVASSVNVEDFGTLLNKLADEAGFSLQVEYRATVLNSSHVVLEDTGLVLGRTLKEIMIRRMQSSGINGAGSSLRSAKEFDEAPIRVGLSVEGRKFVKIVPFSVDEGALEKSLLIGHNVLEGLFSEDMDDFLDGLAGGLGASIMIHIKDVLAPSDSWVAVFKNLGKAIKEAFEPNPCRKGLPPGVKATLS